MKNEFKVEGVDQLNPNGFGGMCSRSIAIRAKGGDEGIETVATTDAPVIVMDWERFSPIREVLPMKYVELPETDKVPLLDSHSRSSIEKVKGSARNWTTNDHQLLAKAYVAKSETALREKIQEGHIDSVSIGYMTDSSYSVEVPKGAKVSIDGNKYINDFEDDIPLVVRTWWKPVELSLVPIGADSDAKFKSIEAIIERKFNELAKKKHQPEHKPNKNRTAQDAELRLAELI